MKLTSKKDYFGFWNTFIAKGDYNALSKIYFHYYDKLFSFGLKHTRDKQIIEDSIQSIFLNFIRSRKSIGIVKNLSAYLISSFRNQLIHELTKQKKTILTDLSKDGQFDYFNTEGDEEDKKENLEQIYKAVKLSISKLTPKKREIIYLRYNSGISYEDIARILNISVDSCYKSVYRSVKKIREEVGEIIDKDSILILWLFCLSTGK